MTAYDPNDLKLPALLSVHRPLAAPEGARTTKLELTFRMKRIDKRPE